MKSILSVNEHPIADETIKAEFNLLRRIYSKRLTADELHKKIPTLQKQAIDQTINRRLLLEEADRRGIDVPESAVNAIVAKAGTSEGGQPDLIRANIRDACRVENLIGQIVSVATEPTEDETLEYLRQSELADPDKSTNPGLRQEILKKSRRLLHLLRKNQVLTDFIADLRKKAVIKYGTEPAE